MGKLILRHLDCFATTVITPSHKTSHISYILLQDNLCYLSLQRNRKMPDNIPDEAPPPYEQAAGSSSKPNQDASGHLAIPGSSSSHGGIPPASRRSMEDEGRSLPEGWVRTFDPKTPHFKLQHGLSISAGECNLCAGKRYSI